MDQSGGHVFFQYRHDADDGFIWSVSSFLGRRIRLERRLDDELDRSSQMAGAFAASQTSPCQRAARREQAVVLADAIAGLPAHYHEIIVLRHFEQLDFPQIARRMERSLDSVKNLWARALARLNRSLKGESHGPR